MPKSKTKEETYDECAANGTFDPIVEIDIDKIESIIDIADEDLITAKDAIAKKRWNSGYKSYYDVLHELVEAFLFFEKVKSSNHKCLFSYLCVKCPELELEWDFFEKARTKRNGINYYGTPVVEKDWKEVALQFDLYINLLKKELEKKIKEFQK